MKKKLIISILVPIIISFAYAANTPLPSRPPFKPWTTANNPVQEQAQESFQIASVAYFEAVASGTDATSLYTIAINARNSYINSYIIQARVLVRGSGPIPNPLPVSVAGHVMLPITNNRNSAVISWDTSSLPLNLYANTTNGPIPEQLEFSLDGGPWIATRSDVIVMPDLGPGVYQIRMIQWPATGNSVPWPITTITRTAIGWTSQ